jgi:hypothetical protein
MDPAVEEERAEERGLDDADVEEERGGDVMEEERCWRGGGARH